MLHGAVFSKRAPLAAGGKRLSFLREIDASQND